MKRYYYTGIAAVIIQVLFIVSTLNALASRSADLERSEEFRVTAVNDGDTVSIRSKSFIGIPLKIERVRLIGIDAPELTQEQWGMKSKRHLKKLISESDWVVNVEFDVEQRDKYGRLLAYLWGKDGRLINERMLEAGHAVLYTFPPNVKYVDRFAEAQKRAQMRRAGIWKEGGLRESPQQWRQKHPRK